MAQPLKQWNVSGETVIVFREADTLHYVKGENYSHACPISNDLIKTYGIQRAEKLITTFHQVIQANLEEKIHSQAFLPLLLTEGYELDESGENYYKLSGMKQVVLFATHIRGVQMQDQFYGKRWAVLDRISREVICYPVEKTNKEAYTFLADVLKNIRKPLPGLYEQFIKRFIPILSYEEDRIKSVTMRCLSMYDPNILLTEYKWTITVISTFGGNGSRWNRKARSCEPDLNTSHGLIACEGLENGKLFLKYAHITQRTNESVAYVKIKDKISSETFNGPTWIRPRHLVEKMMRSIENAQDNRLPVNFSRIRDVSDSARFVSSYAIYRSPYLFFTATVAAIFKFIHWRSQSDSLNFAARAARDFTNDLDRRTNDVISFFSRDPLLRDPHPNLYIDSFAANERIRIFTRYAADSANCVVDSYRNRSLILFSLFMIFTLVALRIGRPNINQLRIDQKSPDNCVSWIRNRLREAGIIIEMPLTAITPLRMVKSLWDERNVTFED
jgi:hypothetical protein